MNIRSIPFAVAIATATSLSAQHKQVSLGVDLAFPQGDFNKEFTLGVGPSAGFELPLGTHFGVTAQASYCILLLKDDIKEVLDGATLIPLQAGLKYFVMESQRGLYLHGQAGVHLFTEKFKENAAFGLDAETESSSRFSWGLGAGYQLEKLDIGLRFNSIAPKTAEDGEEAEAFTYLGLRLGYLINLSHAPVVPTDPSARVAGRAGRVQEGNGSTRSAGHGLQDRHGLHQRERYRALARHAAHRREHR